MDEISQTENSTKAQFFLLCWWQSTLEEHDHLAPCGHGHTLEKKISNVFPQKPSAEIWVQATVEQQKYVKSSKI